MFNLQMKKMAILRKSVLNAQMDSKLSLKIIFKLFKDPCAIRSLVSSKIIKNHKQ